MIKNFNKITDIYTIEVNFTSLTSAKYNYSLISHTNSKKQDKEYTITKIEENEFNNQKPTKIPVLLIFSCRNVITKKLQCDEDEELAITVRKALPNANLDDFYIQVYNIEGDNVKHVSIARKQLIDDVISNFTGKGFFVLGAYLRQFIPYESYICYTKNQPGFKANEITIISKSKNDFFYYQKIIKTIAIALISLFGVLMINFFAFSYFFRKNNEIQTKTSQYSSIISNKNNLNTKISDRMKYLESRGLINSTRYSFYIDRIIELKPSDISLNELTINPLQKKSDNDQPLYRDNILFISGSVNEGISLNKWILAIKTLKWVENVSFLSYNSKENETKAIFNIEVKLKN